MWGFAKRKAIARRQVYYTPKSESKVMQRSISFPRIRKKNWCKELMADGWVRPYSIPRLCRIIRSRLPNLSSEPGISVKYAPFCQEIRERTGPTFPQHVVGTADTTNCDNQEFFVEVRGYGGEERNKSWISMIGSYIIS
jgi:hypothetical protein